MSRHPFDPVSFVFGLVFAALGAVTIVLTEVPIAWLDPRVVLPGAALLVGLWLLASAARRRTPPTGTGATPDAPDADTTETAGTASNAGEAADRGTTPESAASGSGHDPEER